MQRFVSALGFVLGFTGVIALAIGWSTPAASQTDGRTVDSPGAQRILLPGNPSHTSFGTLGADGNYHGVEPPDADFTSDVIVPVAPSHTSFGTLMPDGTYCGVGCPSWDSYNEQADDAGNH